MTSMVLRGFNTRVLKTKCECISTNVVVRSRWNCWDGSIVFQSFCCYCLLLLGGFFPLHHLFSLNKEKGRKFIEDMAKQFS
jgi:hypothetical protein